MADRKMSYQLQKEAGTEAELLGDLTALLDEIGSPAGLLAIAGPRDPLAALAVRNAAGLRSFITGYHSRILQPLELPAVQRAFAHARQNELRELVAYDHLLAAEPAWKDFAAASRIIGLGQLQRLRPLRDERLVQRYLASVEAGDAHGWHTLVFGVALAVYHLPLRPGLIGYAQRTTRGFIQSAARSLQLSTADVESLVEEFSVNLPALVEPLLLPAIVS
jgi:urease accessory protein UreF